MTMADITISGINTSAIHRGMDKVDPFTVFDIQANRFGVQPIKLGKKADEPEGPSFIQVLEDAVNEVQKVKNHAEQISFDYAIGKPIDVHTMMIAVAKADIQMQLTSAIVSKTATSVNQLLQTQI